MEQTRKSRRKTHKGVVLSTKMDKTVVVKLERTLLHPQYGKVITRAKKIYAHNENNPLNVGDIVVVEETRPLSKLKRWRVVA
jgi:small subunit ribosomal protein S17